MTTPTQDAESVRITRVIDFRGWFDKSIPLWVGV